MNLTIIRELLIIYRIDTITCGLDEDKLSIICDKIKQVTKSATAKAAKNSSQMAPACWNLLVQINRLPSTVFSSKVALLETSKVIMACGKIIDSARNELKMGPLDLDKILANLIAKLTEGYRQPIHVVSEHEKCKYLVELIEFVFEKLQGHLNTLESGIRRMSLVEFSTIDDPFIDVKFHGLSPDSIKEKTIKQLCLIALESLCRLVLIFQKGPFERVLDVLTPFHLDSLLSDPETGTKYISHFISSVSKLEFWSQLEWKFWNHLCRFEAYKQFLGYFKKRCHLQLTEPTSTDIPELSMKIIAIVIESEQLTDLMLKAACDCKEFDDEIIGASLKLLLKDDYQKYLKPIESILNRTPEQPISESGLKLLLPALDSLRNGLFHFTRNEQFIKLFAILNDALLKIHLPVKFYVSWTSCVLKFAMEQRKLANVPDLVGRSITGLLKSFDELPDDIKPKVQKIIAQTVSIAGNGNLLRQFILKFEKSIAAILEASVFNLPQDYFVELSLLVRNDVNLLDSWIKVLSNQVQVTSRAFQFTDIKVLHHLSKIISKQVFDQFKASQYIEFIYIRMRELGCSQETIMLSQQLSSSKKLKTDYMFSDSNIQRIVNFIRNYKETGQLNFEDLILENVIAKSEMENELYEEFLNIILVHAPKDNFNDILSRFDDTFKTANRMKCLFTNCRWDHLIEGAEIYKSHSLYLKVNETFLFVLSINFCNLGRIHRCFKTWI